MSQYNLNIPNANIGSLVQGEVGQINVTMPANSPQPAQSKPPINLFISYRRSASSNFAEALYLHLLRHFEKERIFLDTKLLTSGLFPEQLQANIKRSHFFLLTISSGTFDRINEPDDWVFREIKAALDAQKVIIPVCEEGAPMFDRLALPTAIEAVRQYNGIIIYKSMFAESVDALVNRLILPGLKKA